MNRTTDRRLLVDDAVEIVRGNPLYDYGGEDTVVVACEHISCAYGGEGTVVIDGEDILGDYRGEGAVVVEGENRPYGNIGDGPLVVVNHCAVIVTDGNPVAIDDDACPSKAIAMDECAQSQQLYEYDYVYAYTDRYDLLDEKSLSVVTCRIFEQIWGKRKSCAKGLHEFYTNLACDEDSMIGLYLQFED